MPTCFTLDYEERRAGRRGFVLVASKTTVTVLL